VLVHGDRIERVGRDLTALTRRSAVDGIRKERRGFASMSSEKQREIASKGGRAAHEKGTAHEWTADEARAAGRKGGQISRGGRGRLMATPNSPEVIVGAVSPSGIEPGRVD
jgi:general stress protein YciG